MPTRQITIEEKRQFAGILEYACQELEISDSQYKDAEGKYQAVGKWLATSEDLRLSDAEIYPQGSMRLGTTVMPLSHDEFDIDLVCHLPKSSELEPAILKSIVGDRLAAHETYRTLREELNRGWRIDYANAFHLDITPSIPNPRCTNGGILVPDRKLRSYSPSNPEGFAQWFEAQSALQPSHRQRLTEGLAAAREIAPLPDQQPLKGILRRTIQILKRHRDTYFDAKPESIRDAAPISVIITTLAAHAYRHAVLTETYDNDLDVVFAVIDGLPNGIETTQYSDQTLYRVRNPSTVDEENFAEKWNTDPERADWFFLWHAAAARDIRAILNKRHGGLDYIAESMAPTFGERTTNAALTRYSDIVNSGRKNFGLAVGASGIITPSGSNGTGIKNNTFFGN